MKFKYLLFLTIVLAILVLFTISTGYPKEQPFESCPLKEDIGEIKFRESSNVITLRHALIQALLKNPELIAYSSEIHAKEARALQARLRPNPELGIIIENFAGQGRNQDFDAAETSIEISQLILLAGKRQKRYKLALLESDVTKWEYKIRQLDILNATTIAFIDVLQAQEQLNLSQELLRLAKEIYKTVVERVKAGKVSPIEETRTSVILSTAQVQLEKAKNRLRAARKQLASMWGCKTPHFKKAIGKLTDVTSIPTIERLNKLIKQNPEITRWMIEIKRAQALLELERAKRIPDLKLSWGMRRFEETDDYAFLFSLSIPLPIFNRNQGGILEAQSKLSKAYEERKAIEIYVRTELAKAYKALSSSYTEVLALKQKILPAAQKAFYAIREGYKRGKFSYLDVLDAQKTLFNTKKQYIEALAAYHKAKTKVARLIGQSLKNLNADIKNLNQR